MPDGTTTATVETDADGKPTKDTVKTEPNANLTTEQIDALLGDAWKRAIREEREARKDAVARAETAEKLAKDATSDREKAIADAKAETRREILEEANGRLLRAEIKAAATGKLAHPELAVKLLDLDAFKVADDGSVDVKAIDTALDKLITDHPELKATILTGSADGGRQGDPTPPKIDMNTLLRAAAKG